MSDFAKDFREWITRGSGQAMFGGVIKAAAGTERRRITKRLETPNLFPHLEHEDRVALEKADHATRHGQKMIEECHAREAAIGGMLDADAGLKITADDLKPYADKR